MMENREIFLQEEKRSKEKGFTLIELLVVMAIIAILAAIAIPQFNKYRANAMLSNVQGMAKNLANIGTGLATTGVQNPDCTNATTISVITNKDKTATTAADCTKSDKTCYEIAVADGKVCDAAAVWDNANNVKKPNWINSLNSNFSLTVLGTGISVASGGVITVKSTYKIATDKYIGCKYDPATDTFDDVDNTYVCKTNP